MYAMVTHGTVNLPLLACIYLLAVMRKSSCGSVYSLRTQHGTIAYPCASLDAQGSGDETGGKCKHQVGPSLFVLGGVCGF